MEVVYIDVLILTNFIFHLIALYLTAQLTKINFHLRYCIFSAFLSAVTGAWALIWCQNIALLSCIVAITIGSMTLLSYRPKRVVAFIRLFIVLSFTLLTCGTITFYFLMLAVNRLGVTDAKNSDAKILLFAIISSISSITIGFSNRVFKKETEKSEVRVKVEMGKKTVSFLCLTDTGCTVKDPIDGKHILFIPSKEGKNLFNEQDYQILKKGDISKISKLSELLQKKIRMVPCTTIMGGHLLMCILADKILINGSEKTALIALRTDSNDAGTGICPASIL